MTYGQNYLMHYGVKGQKWGQRRYVDYDGTLLAEGRARLQDRRSQQGIVSNAAPQVKASPKAKLHAIRKSSNKTEALSKTSTPKPINERKRRRTKRLIAAAAGVALVIAGAKAYQKSTELRDNMRKDIMENMGKGHESINTLSSKYWDSADRTKYGEMARARAKFVADNTTRTDALAAKLHEKTGIRVNIPKSREKVLAERRSQNELANFFRSAENRGAKNKEIHDARQDLKNAKRTLEKYKTMHRSATQEKYKDMFIQKHTDNVAKYKKRLDDLMRNRSGH